MNVTLKILKQCDSGCHITVEATIDGSVKKQFVVTRQFLTAPLDEDIDVIDVFKIILRNQIKEQGLTTAVQIKNYVESHTFKW